MKFCLGSSRGSDEERAQLGRAEKGQAFSFRSERGVTQILACGK